MGVKPPTTLSSIVPNRFTKGGFGVPDSSASSASGLAFADVGNALPSPAPNISAEKAERGSQASDFFGEVNARVGTGGENMACILDLMAAAAL